MNLGGTKMVDYKIFSGDSHLSEPGDLWEKRIDKEFRWRAPHVERRERNGKMEDVFLYEGWPPHPVGVGLGAAAYASKGKGPEAASFREEGKGYEDALPGGWDPAARLKDQDIDGVDGEVLYTTLGFRQFWIRDPRLQRAAFRAYNDWLSEFCSYSPNRLVGLSLISMYDVDEARAELRRSAKLGYHGAMIGTTPPPECLPYHHSEIYDPFWAEAQDLGMTLVWHENTGGHESRSSSGSSYWDENQSIGALVRFHEVQRSMGHMIVSGVFERFPKLKLVVAEQGTDWLPFYVKRLQRMRAGTTSYGNKLPLKPIEYFHRNTFWTYMDDPEIVEERELVGVDNLLFATDYPHSASSWPNSQLLVDRDMESIPDDHRRKMIRDNTLSVFNIGVPAGA